MFFMMGIAPGQKQLDFSQLVCCPVCGQYSRMEVWCSYTVLSLFLIPVLKWGRRYFVRMRCCGAQCELPAELGRALARGQVRELDVSALHFSQSGSRVRRCAFCGFTTAEDFAFCPKCGRPL